MSAYAQEKVAAVGFTDSLTFYDLSTWGFILLWGGIGCIGRCGADYKAGLINSPKDIALLSVSSMIAGFLGFVTTELICQAFEYLPPSGAIGGIVLLAAYMNIRTYDILMDALSGVVHGVANKFPKKENE